VNARPRRRRYLHWPTPWRRAHAAAMALMPLLLATGVALYWPPVHTVLIPVLPVVYDAHVALGLIWLFLMLAPVVAPPRFAGRRTLSTLDWLPLLALGVGTAVTGGVLVAPGVFSAAWRAVEFTGHGVFAVALAVAVAAHALARAERWVVRQARFDPARRQFLRYALYGAGAALVLPWLGRLPLALARSGGEEAQVVEGEFITYSAAGFIPYIPRSKYRLEVTGAVASPLNLTYEELLALPRTEVVRNFQCVTGWVVPSVHWAGVRLADLLARAGPLPGETVVQFESADGIYTDTLSGDQLFLPDVLLAYEMEGKPLPPERGGPVRLVVPPMYGYKSVKWVRRIRVTNRVVPGFWEQRGYAVDAWIQMRPPPPPSCGGHPQSMSTLC
jgi:DMSO/TMAO reductase YedYZ molybdopterin-dependent catalytic subunit